MPWLAVVVITLGFVNISRLMAISSALGGDALNGYERDGHYVVASHGSYTEVAQTAWTVNRVHAILTLLPWPAVMLAMAFMVFRYMDTFHKDLEVTIAGPFSFRRAPDGGRDLPRAAR